LIQADAVHCRRLLLDSMGLLRRSRLVPARLRLKVSWWTSAGVACFLLVAVSAFGLRETNGREADERRLGETYPDDLLIEAKGDPRYSDAGNKYWVFIHVILIGYMFLGLNTVCDIYFTGALEVMVDKWDIKPDVAGATFMAAGGSAPELFSSLIGACYLSNDVGFSTIVGSAVFNVLFVIGLCGAVVSEPIPLTWWPLFRDCLYYICGLIMLAIFAYTGNQIGVAEAIVLFLGYILYCTIMYYNANLENFVKKGTCRLKKEDGTPTKPSQVAPINEAITDKNLRDTAQPSDNAPGPPEHHKGVAAEGFAESGQATSQPTNQVIVAGSTQSKSKLLVPPVASLGFSNAPTNAPAGEIQKSPRGSHIRVNHFTQHHSSPRTSPRDKDKKGDDDGVKGVDGEEKEENGEEEGSNAEDDVEELVIMPEEPLARFFWILKLPIYGSLYFLTPKPTERKFLFTFVVSLLWIGAYSYFLIWWVDLIVGMVSLDITIAGLTVLAAGTSIPDLVSSMAVAKAGEGDMAVSSSIGSNIFDILVGLPFPWMIKILIIQHDPGYTIDIQSPYIVVYVLILLFMVFCVITSIHFLGWRLNKCLGLCMALLYGVFMVLALILEIGKPEWAKI